MLAHLKLAHQEARKIKLPAGVNRGDLYQEARYGLCLAAFGADPAKPFPTFARLVVRQTLLRAMKKLPFTIRSKRRQGPWVGAWPADDFEPRWIAF